MLNDVKCDYRRVFQRPPVKVGWGGCGVLCSRACLVSWAVSLPSYVANTAPSSAAAVACIYHEWGGFNYRRVLRELPAKGERSGCVPCRQGMSRGTCCVTAPSAVAVVCVYHKWDITWLPASAARAASERRAERLRAMSAGHVARRSPRHRRHIARPRLPRRTAYRNLRNLHGYQGIIVTCRWLWNKHDMAVNVNKRRRLSTYEYAY